MHNVFFTLYNNKAMIKGNSIKTMALISYNSARRATTFVVIVTTT